MPYRLERNRNGGGVLVYVCEDIPSKQLKMHKILFKKKHVSKV